MQVRIISCWFATSYGAYTSDLRVALQKQLETEIGIIASNCGCGDAVEVRRQFQSTTSDYFEFPHLCYYKSKSRFKYWLRNRARHLLYRERARRYLSRTGNAEVVHFQQTLNALGSVAVFNWLKMRSRVAKVVTIHELDAQQLDFPETNLTYNRADRIIVLARELKEQLISLGVDSERIDIIEHGVTVYPPANKPREGILFYGGHHFGPNKGVETLFAAMAIVRKELGAKAPILTVHGHYGETTPEYGLKCAEKAGLNNIRWLNQVGVKATMAEYDNALLCVLPFTGSFAGFPAVTAMAHGVPVIGTRRAGLPEHLGDLGVWIEANDAQGLAAAILKLLGDDASRRELADRGRARAAKLFTWDIIAAKTITSYQKAIESRKSR
jgi:glycosyltransferase involved in cell wall biosynthesis